MIAPGAKGSDEGVELVLDGGRVGARVAAIVRSSKFLSPGPVTRRFYWRIFMKRTLFALALAALAAGSTLSAQQGGRQASPDGAAAAQVGGKYVASGEARYEGGKWIDILYGRPLKRGRELWGSGANYGKMLNDGAPVWRAGANVSTRLTTEAALTIGNKTIPAGEYSLFIDAKSPTDWTLIVSSWAAQPRMDQKDKTALWGAYGYTPEKDVARVPMKIEALPFSVEQLTWAFLDLTADGGRMAISWATTVASVTFKAQTP